MRILRMFIIVRIEAIIDGNGNGMNSGEEKFWNEFFYRLDLKKM